METCRILALFCQNGKMVYFDADGKPISQEQYNQSKRERLEQKKKEKEKILKKLSLIKDSQGRPVYNAQGRKIKYAAPIKTKHNKATKPKMEYDQYGRPLYDAEGNMITYQYWVVFKVCESCNREIPLKTRAGQRCPYCGAVWQWPDEAKITEKGIQK